MRGEDRKAWLQGQSSNDIRQLRPGGSTHFCICSPTGQMLALCTAFSLDDRYLILTPKACASAVAERVSSMVILEDVVCHEVTEHFEWLSVQGPEASRELGATHSLPTLEAGEVEGSLLLRFDRTGLGGWDLLSRKGPAAAKQNFTRVLPEAVEIARLEAGIPIYGKDISERTLPPEVGTHFESQYVSYSKGCYTGQEVLMRIHSRGHTNKTWVGLLLDEAVKSGSEVASESREDVGTVTSVADSPHYGPIAAATIRNEDAAEGTTLTVNGPQGPVHAEVVKMPILRFH